MGIIVDPLQPINCRGDWSGPIRDDTDHHTTGIELRHEVSGYPWSSCLASGLRHCAVHFISRVICSPVTSLKVVVVILFSRHDSTMSLLLRCEANNALD